MPCKRRVFCIRLNSRNLNTVMCFADRSGIGRAQIWEEPVESLFTILHQWHPDLWEGCMGREYPQHPKFSADSQLLWPWVCGGRMHSVLSSVICGPAETGSKCQEAPAAAWRDAQLLSWGTGKLSTHLHWARSSGRLSFFTKLKLLF